MSTLPLPLGYEAAAAAVACTVPRMALAPSATSGLALIPALVRRVRTPRMSEYRGQDCERVRKLEAEVRALRAALARAQDEARTDALTGVLSRRGWDDVLVAEEARCVRHGLDAIVVVVDLDGLKGINDAGGHASGDQLLRHTARALTHADRGHDAIARTGGDEFAVLAVQTTPNSAALIEQRVTDVLAMAGIHATLAAAPRAEHSTIPAAWKAADELMLARKAGNLGVRPSAP